MLCNEKKKNKHILFYSILFYSILFYSLLRGEMCPSVNFIFHPNKKFFQKFTFERNVTQPAGIVCKMTYTRNERIIQLGLLVFLKYFVK